jgi:hypothetical protein
MADTAGPFDGGAWSQDQWYRFAPAWAPSGILGTSAASVGAGSFGVTAVGRTLTVATGRAYLAGSGYEPEAAKTVTATANTNGSLSRRDRLVLRRDLTAKTILPVIIAGTPASTPVAPSLTQVDTGVYDVAVCSFLVPPNSGTALSDFVDERLWITPRQTFVQATAPTYAPDGSLWFQVV